jgi:hypothetical protein
LEWILLRKSLKKPWVAALTTTLLVLAVWVALLHGDGTDPGSATLPPLSPSGGELVMSAGFAVFLFLVLWALYWLAARFKLAASGRLRSPGSARGD